MKHKISTMLLIVKRYQHHVNTYWHFKYWRKVLQYSPYTRRSWCRGELVPKILRPDLPARASPPVERQSSAVSPSAHCSTAPRNTRDPEGTDTCGRSHFASSSNERTNYRQQELFCAWDWTKRSRSIWFCTTEHIASGGCCLSGSSK